MVPSTQSRPHWYLVQQMSWLLLKCVQIDPKTYSNTPKTHTATFDYGQLLMNLIGMVVPKWFHWPNPVQIAFFCTRCLDFDYNVSKWTQKHTLRHQNSHSYFLWWSIINGPDWDGRPIVVPSTQSSSDCYLVQQMSWLRLKCVQIDPKTYSKTPKLTQLFLIMVNY